MANDKIIRILCQIEVGCSIHVMLVAALQANLCEREEVFHQILFGKKIDDS